MAFIKVIPPQQATDRLAQIYRRVAAASGQVDNVLQVHSLRPHTLDGHMMLYKAVLHHPGNRLPSWLLEAIGVRVSRRNGCAYCDQHHSAGLRRLLGDEARFRALQEQLDQDVAGAPFTPAEQAAMAYADKLNAAPGAIHAADIEQLRASGYSDGQILEINQATAYFAYVNRTVSGLGVDTNGEKLGLTPDKSDDLGRWTHR